MRLELSKILRYAFYSCLLSMAPIVNSQELITHPSVSTVELSRSSLRSIFAMRTPTWPDGKSIHVFVLADSHPSHILFCKKYLGMFPYQLRRIWDRQVYSGLGISPTTVDSLEQMRHQVASTPGAIGYISDELINDSVHIIEELL